MEKRQKQILFVEQDEVDISLVQRAFSSAQATDSLVFVRNLLEARRHLLKSSPDLIVIDLVFPEGKGTELLTREERNRIPVIVLSSQGDEQQAVEAIKAGALDYMVKSRETLLDMPHIVERALREWELIVHNLKAQKALEESEEKFRNVVEQATDGIGIVRDGSFLYLNPSLLKTLDLQEGEAIGLPLNDFFIADGLPETVKLNSESKGPSTIYEGKVKRRDGSTRFAEFNIGPTTFGYKEAVLYVVRDVTDRKIADYHLKLALKEKEALLQEIHHRVKNNLQVIASLLSLQSAYTKDEIIREMFTESRDRIRSMALVHEKLYESGDFSSIDFSKYVVSLANDLILSHRIDPKRIAFDARVDKVFLTIEQAVPCGLILNELLTNSFKHGYPETWGGKGKIHIRMVRKPDHQISLTVSDNGAGLPKQFNIWNSPSLGLRLVTILVTEQLKGQIDLERSKGTRFKIVFPDPHSIDNPAGPPIPTA